MTDDWMTEVNEESLRAVTELRDQAGVSDPPTYATDEVMAAIQDRNEHLATEIEHRSRPTADALAEVFRLAAREDEMSWKRKRNRNGYDLAEPCQKCPHTLADHSAMSGPCHHFDGQHLCQCPSMTWAPDPSEGKT